MNDVLERIKRSKLWVTIGGGGSGIAMMQEGLTDAAAPDAVRIATIIAGAIITIGSVVAYVMKQGSIDELKAIGKETGKDVVETILKPPASN